MSETHKEVSQLHFKVNTIQEQLNNLHNPMSNFQTQLNSLQGQLTELQKNQADLSTKMLSLNKNITILNEKLDENKNRMSLLSLRFDDIQSNIVQRMDSLCMYLSSATVSISPPPSEVYRLAYNDYTRGKYDLATIGFRTYLDKYPQGELGPQAQYYLADCYFVKNNWEMAIQELNKLVKNYNFSDLIPSAMLKKSLCYNQLQKTEEFKKELINLTTSYPNSPEAEQAKERLISISSTTVR